MKQRHRKHRRPVREAGLLLSYRRLGLRRSLCLTADEMDRFIQDATSRGFGILYVDSAVYPEPRPA